MSGQLSKQHAWQQIRDLLDSFENSKVNGKLRAC